MLLVLVFLHRPTRNCSTPGNNHAMLFKSKSYLVVRSVSSSNYYRCSRALKNEKKVINLGGPSSGGNMAGGIRGELQGT